MRRSEIALAAIVVSGCYAAIPPPVDPGSLPACSAGSYGVLGRDACEVDADCHACAAGASCVASSAACEFGTCRVACCQHRCTVVQEDTGLSSEASFE